MKKILFAGFIFLNGLIWAFGNENDSDKEILRKLNRVNERFTLRGKTLSDFVNALFCRVVIEKMEKIIKSYNSDQKINSFVRLLKDSAGVHPLSNRNCSIHHFINQLEKNTKHHYYQKKLKHFKNLLHKIK